MPKLLLALIVVLLTACQSEIDRQLEYVLNATSKNRAALEHVVAHYDSIGGDKEKTYAAKWLIVNSTKNTTAYGKVLDDFYMRLDSAYAANDSDFMALRLFYANCMKFIPWKNVKQKRDLEYISAEYLIRNIDQAFEVRNSPWSRNLSLDEFCEYILPYKINNEEVEDWRSEYKEYFASVFDTINIEADSSEFDVCRALSLRYVGHNYNYPAGVPSYKPSFLKKTLIGPCSDYSNLLVFFGRTFGIPVVIDYVPHWANYPHSHSWSAVLVGGKPHAYVIGEKNFLGDHVKRFSNVMTKTFRKTTSPQKTSLKYISGSRDLPPAFQSANMIDVTSEYLSVTDIKIKKLFKVDFDPDYLYLCVFDNKNWYAIDWAEISLGSATFHNVGMKRALYMPMYYHNGEYIPAQEPFIVNEQGESSRIVADKQDTTEVILTRKYLETRARVFQLYIKGGHLQLANKSDFTDAVDYVIPDSIGLNYQSWQVGGGEYRYVRFFPKKGRFAGNISEMEVYGVDGNEIFGKPIGNLTDTLNCSEKAFDKNLLSFAVCKDSTEWVGLDLGKPISISHVDYLPRTDDNFIRDGEEYELFYWDKGWRSLGKQIGSRKTQQLIYNNVPRGALLLLRDLTKGTEERIFTYEDGKQVFY